MANARIAHLSLDGSTDQFDVTFPYVNKTHVIVKLDGVATTAFTWLTDTRIQMNSMPGSGTNLIITRETSPTVRLVDYQTGSILSETILDTDSQQAFFLCQEANDVKELVLNASDATNQWDATSKRITNVSDPTSDQDAATKAYVVAQDAVTTSGISTSVTAAANSATAAATSATASATSATTSASSATAAASSASTASGHATTASNYALKVDGAVTGTDFSAKAWAIGGTNVTDTASRGAAKEWAIKVEDNTVDGSGYSALHHAAKAAASATAASNSATAAAQGQLYSTVSNKTGDFTATTGNDGTYFICDTSSGNITVTLPTIGSNEGLRMAFQKSSGSNSLILDPQSTDTVNGSTSNYTLSENSEVVLLVADDASPDNWVATIQSQTVAGDGLTKTGSTMAIDYTRDQAWTGSQRSTPVVDNDGSFDMNAGNNFTCTPSGNFALTFTNITSGQGGLVYLINTGGHTVTKDSAVKADANFLTTVTAAGTYLVAYYSPDGTSVVVTNSLAVT